MIKNLTKHTCLGSRRLLKWLEGNITDPSVVHKHDDWVFTLTCEMCLPSALLLHYPPDMKMKMYKFKKLETIWTWDEDDFLNKKNTQKKKKKRQIARLHKQRKTNKNSLRGFAAHITKD